MSDPYRTPCEQDEQPIVISMTWSERVSKAFWIALGTSVGLGLAAALLYPLAACVLASGKRDFCYIAPAMYTQHGEQYYRDDSYELWEHIPWRQDRLLARTLKTTEDVRAEALKFGCEIR